ncbi:MAG: hypothetical protein BWY11_01203 [Firmicutes bacterium ADurb.Bin182]|nr:MAG: hypothetical protein BWY11_01203 [Firmicutes bacterium ADurb.Bin182]
MKPEYQKTIALTAAAALFIFFAGAAGAGGCLKEETVYAKLAQNGELLSAYVINSFELKTAQTVTDYGNYINISNLTDTKPIEADGDKITLKADAGRFYYQGNLEKAELPWLIRISYTLNGKEMSAKQAAGKSGQLKIRIAISKNPKAEKAFAETFSLQTVVTLNRERFFNIKSEGAIHANSGGKQTLTYTLLPGCEAEYVIHARVQDFSMEGIRFGAALMSADFGVPVMGDISDSLSDLREGVARLDEGASSLASGSSGLRSGMKELRNGAVELKSGAGELADGLGQLDAGAKRAYEGALLLEDGALKLANGLSRLTQSGNELNDGAVNIFQGLIDMANAQLKSYEQALAALGIEIPELTRDNYSLVLENLLGVIGGAAGQKIYNEVKEQITLQATLAAERQMLSDLLAGTGLAGEELEDAVDDAMGDEARKSELLEQAKTLMIRLAAKDYVLSFDPSLSGEALNLAVDSALSDPAVSASLTLQVEQRIRAEIDETVTRLMADPATQQQINDALPLALKNNEQYQSLLNLKFQLDGIAAFCGGVYEYTRGVAEAARGTGKLYFGLNKMSGGIDELNEGASLLCAGAKELENGAGSLYGGADEIYGGMKRLDEGIADLCKGTGEFYEQVSGMNFGSDLDEFIKSVSAPDIVPVSFTDARNTVSGVQFVMMSEEIEAEEADKPEVVSQTPKQKTFWQKLAALFGL